MPPDETPSPPQAETATGQPPYDRLRAPLSWREPTAPDREPLSVETAAEDESLPETIERVRRSQHAQQQQGWHARRNGLGAFFGGLAFLAVGAFVIWFNCWWTGKLEVPVRLVLILLLPLGISLAGLYTFLTGHQIVGFTEGLAWDITIGPEGIKREPVGGLIDGQIIYWHGIECVEYEEDFTLGTARTLVVHLGDGRQQRIRIAREVTAEQLAETVSAYGKELKLAEAGDWCKQSEPDALSR
jgi:hypothetical protein